MMRGVSLGSQCREDLMHSISGWQQMVRSLLGSSGSRKRVGSRRFSGAEMLEIRSLLTNPLTALPMLASLPGAPVNVYLDFNGNIEAHPNWNSGNTVTTPVYSVDNDYTTYTDEELRRIEEMWHRVSEDFAPFNVNVTTIEPSAINDFESIRVAIGGNGSWFGAGAVGVAILNGFSVSSFSNTVYVFPELDQNPKHISNTISHEAGHCFGLQHQSSFDANGNKTAEYRQGSATVGPIMGFSDQSLRDIWDLGPSSPGADVIQDDMAMLTRVQNQTFRYRTDDFGSTRPTASLLPSSQTGVVDFRGILETNTDSDFFYFDADAGQVSFTIEGLNVNNYYPGLNLVPGTNLDAIVRLYDASGAVLVEDNPGNSLGGAVSFSVSAGRYFLEVTSTDEYGSVGQFFVDGSFTPMPGVPTMVAPTGTLSNAVPEFVWTQGAGAVSYDLLVERRNASTGVWSTYYRRNVTGLNHIAEQQFPQGDFRASVRTVTSNGSVTDYSNLVSFTVDIPSPSTPVMLRPQGDIGVSFPTFEWTASANAATYNLWVSRVSNGERVIYRTAFAGTSYVHFSALPDGNYRAWVQAVNTVGETSAWSSMVAFTIDAPIPATPVLTAPAATTTSSNPRFTWNLVEAAASYDLWVNNLTTGRTQYLRVSDLPYDKGFYDPPAFDQGNYVAWIRAANGNGEYSPWSIGHRFTVDILPPSTPVMTGPIGATATPRLITTVNPTFTWTAAARAVRYELWANNMTTGQFQIIRRTDITTTSFTSLSNLTQGAYRAWVRGINSAGEVGEWSPMFTFTIDEATPSVPVITDPKPNLAGSVENPNPTFIWTMANRAPFYELQIDNTTLGTTRVVSVSGLTTESYTIPTAQRLGEFTYSARVRAYNASGETSEWSERFVFRIDVPNPATPTIIGPKDTITDRTPTFTWTHDRASFRYEILVRDMVRNENIVLNVLTFQLNPSGTEASYTLPDGQALRPSTYRFWIRAFNSLGQSSNWSLAQAFVIAANEAPAKKNDSPVLVAALQPELGVFADEASERVAPPQSVIVAPVEPVEPPKMMVPAEPADAVVMASEGDLIDEVMAEIMQSDALLNG